MTKTITIMVIVAAFVAGTITTSSVAFAANSNDDDNPIVEALYAIVDAINGIEPDVTVNAPQGDKGDKGDSCTIDGTVVSCEDGTSSDVQGPQGDTGSQGPQGTLSTYQLAESFNEDGFGGADGTVTCEEGDLVLSGGYAVNPVANVRTSIPWQSSGSGTPYDSWRVQATDIPIGSSLNVRILCQDNP